MNKEENWQTKFLNRGTELGLGDLSMMIGTVSEIRSQAQEEAYREGREARCNSHSEARAEGRDEAYEKAAMLAFHELVKPCGTTMANTVANHIRNLKNKSQ